LLQSIQEIMLNERIGVTGQVVPLLCLYTGDIVGKNNFHRIEVVSFKLQVVKL